MVTRRSSMLAFMASLALVSLVACSTDKQEATRTATATPTTTLSVTATTSSVPAAPPVADPFDATRFKADRAPA